MKRTLFVVLLFSAMLLRAQGREDFIVEQLTPAEIKLLDEAEKEFSAAQNKHSLTLLQVETNHGHTASISPNWMRPCGSVVTSVELRGKYALITRTIDRSSCPVPALLSQ
jgi:hypothetical protein